ncbi:MAG: Rpn family recombination-promoting nuclease/putative transposase [Hyphomicrobiaceae bacterium]|nr:Rpn family recombination-promoting nuclease/putative transposase [Hyphomicrobiaceae bacterium]
MSKSPGPIHDRFFKHLLKDPDTMGLFLRERLPGKLAALLGDEPPALVPGSFVDEALSEHFSDLLYKVGLKHGGAAYIYVLADHKSAPDKGTALQLQRYMNKIWQSLSKQGETPLPRILPVVVYHGVRRWNIPTSFAAMCEDARDELAPYLPDFEYMLIDLSEIDDGDLSSDQRLRAFLTVMKHIQRSDFLDHTGTIMAELHHLEPVDIITILRYVIRKWRDRISRKTIDGLVLDVALEKREKIMGSVVDEWIEQGYKQGKAEGKTEGVAGMLSKMLELRFGPLPERVKERIGKADADTLTNWGERVIDAPDLDAVFEKH